MKVILEKFMVSGIAPSEDCNIQRVGILSGKILTTPSEASLGTILQQCKKEESRMTPKEAAEKWSKQKRTTEETVNRWVIDDRIPYTEEDGVVNIPDIKRPHIIRRDIRVTDKKVRDHILKATNRLEYIDAKAFLGKLNDYEFAARIIELENEGKIKRMANAPSVVGGG